MREERGEQDKGKASELLLRCSFEKQRPDSSQDGVQLRDRDGALLPHPRRRPRRSHPQPAHQLHLGPPEVSSNMNLYLAIGIL